MIALKKIYDFITDSKNIRMLMFAGAVIFCLLYLHQCNQTRALKDQVNIEKQEATRALNNYNASRDSVKTYKLNDSTWISEKKGYELSLKELKNEYSDLLEDFKVEKNKPPKTVIKVETKIVEVIKEVPVYITLDSNGVENFTFKDSVNFADGNSRTLTGKIPYNLIYNKSKDSTLIKDTTNLGIYAKVVPGNGTFKLHQEISLSTGLFKNEKTGEIEIQVSTKYPNLVIKNIEGANVMSDPISKKVARGLRKTWSIGVNVGYGIGVSPKAGTFGVGPYIGIGLSYNPKILQFGK